VPVELAGDSISVFVLPPEAKDRTANKGEYG
jgi:hypothetical protein